MLKDLRENEKGVVLITVLMLLIIMMALAVQITAMRVTQTMSEFKMARQVQAEILAQGMLSLIYANQLTSSPGNYFQSNYIIDGISYNVIGQISNVSNGIYNTYPLQINVYY